MRKEEMLSMMSNILKPIFWFQYRSMCEYFSCILLTKDFLKVVLNAP